MAPDLSVEKYVAAIAATTAAALAAAAVTFFILRRAGKFRAKLANLVNPDPEASKDYQDLCRVRMQTKPIGKNNDNNPEQPRIISNISRENELNDSPTNRSSTSSWGDESALSNMDISTGHMVLVSFCSNKIIKIIFCLTSNIINVY